MQVEEEGRLGLVLKSHAKKEGKGRKREEGTGPANTLTFIRAVEGERRGENRAIVFFSELLN